MTQAVHWVTQWPKGLAVQTLLLDCRCVFGQDVYYCNQPLEGAGDFPYLFIILHLFLHTIIKRNK